MDRWTGGRMDGRTDDGHREFLPILPDFVPYRGHCPPYRKIEANKEMRGKESLATWCLWATGHESSSADVKLTEFVVSMTVPILNHVLSMFCAMFVDPFNLPLTKTICTILKVYCQKLPASFVSLVLFILVCWPFFPKFDPFSLKSSGVGGKKNYFVSKVERSFLHPEGKTDSFFPKKPFDGTLM